jgi:hypothetical protein
MKRFWVRGLIGCAAIAAAVVVGRCVVVDGAGDGGGDCQGGDIQGTESLGLVVLLTPTAAAPSNATGRAHLEVEDENSNTTAKLELEVAGLDPGTYTVSVSTNAGTPEIVLGTFDFTGTGDNEEDDSSGDGTNMVAGSAADGSSDQNDQGDNEGDSAEIVFGDESGTPFPDGLNPMALLSLSISDTNGNVVLSGDFTNLSHSVTNDFDAEVECEAGPADPGATGTASLHSTMKHHKLQTKFALTVQGLGPKSTYALVLNGIRAGTLHSNSAGMLKAKKLPRGLSARSLVTIKLLDKNGQLAASAYF